MTTITTYDHDAADLFCGAGGTSTGLLQACRELRLSVRLRAVNHSTVAIRTHSVNHPEVRHHCDEIENTDPRTLVPGGRLLILVASPECTYFSNARGGRPMSDQSRASARYVLLWAQSLTVENILLENVPEFTGWGPLLPCDCGAGDDAKDHAKGCTFGRPDPERKGEYFEGFLSELRALGYTLDWRVLTCADYGDATTRRRFFLQAKLARGAVVTWPRASHAPRQSAPAAGLKPWRPVRDIIDWSVRGTSIYGRKTLLRPNTMRRIYAGLAKFGGLEFVIGQQSGASPRSVDDPMPTVAGAGAISFVQPFIVVLRNHADAQSVDDPLPALTANGQHMGVAQPFIIGTAQTGGNGTYTYPINRPLSTVTSKQEHALIQPFIVPVTHQGGPERAHDVQEPLPTVTGAHRGEMALCRPYLIKYHGSHQGKADGDGRSHGVDEPIPTLDTSNRFGLCEPYLMVNRTHCTPLSLDDPLRTLTTGNNFGLCEPFLVSYYGTGQPLDLADPLDTITTRDRFGLVQPELVRSGAVDPGDVVGWLDVAFRMLQPHELAGAHSFPKKYYFFGTQEQQVKQVGNSVPVLTAKALCLEILQPYTRLEQKEVEWREAA